MVNLLVHNFVPRALRVRSSPRKTLSSGESHAEGPGNEVGLYNFVRVFEGFMTGGLITGGDYNRGTYNPGAFV